MKEEIIDFNLTLQDIKDVKIFFGKYDGIQRYDRYKYPVTKKLVELQQAQKWFPSEHNFSKDKLTVAHMDNGLKEVYQDNLGFQTLADSLANRYLDNVLSDYITSPEWEAVIKWQANFELLHCYIDGTEVLTADGFKDFKDLTYKDLVANYWEGNKVTYTIPTSLVSSNYNGNIHVYENDFVHQAVTPNHRVVTLDKDDNVLVTEARDLYLNDQYFITGNETGTTFIKTDASKVTARVEKYNGIIRCATVDSGMLIIRSNGKMMVSGNSESYSHNIREVYGDPEAFFKEVLAKPEVQDRLKLEIAIYKEFSVNMKNPKLSMKEKKLSLFKTLVAQYCLENIRFFISFLYTFKINDITKSGLPGTNNSITLIANDENIHTVIFKHLINILMTNKDEEFTDIFKDVTEFKTMVIEIFDAVIESELSWYDYLSSKAHINGMNRDQVKDFLHNYANIAINNIKLGKPYSRLKIPTELIDFFEKKKAIRGTKTLGMEQDNNNYTSGALVELELDNTIPITDTITSLVDKYV